MYFIASSHNKFHICFIILFQENRWKKKGISLVPMNYPFGFWGSFYSTVSVFAEDGTVAITHGCTEVGQGLNTKVWN